MAISYPFKGTLDVGEKIAKRDAITFREWECFRTSTHLAALRIARNNREYVMEDDEFEEVANSLGYIRDEASIMEAWRRQLITDEEAAKMMSKLYGKEMSAEAFVSIASLI